MIRDSIKFVFFGTPELSVEILEHLKGAGLAPSLVVTNPDRPQGRSMRVAPPPVKEWAVRNGIPVLQPEHLNHESGIMNHEPKPDLFVVVAYGKIIPKSILEIPKKGTLNIHYSLLPKYRGASPIESAILGGDREVGVTIMLMDEKMDHGPVVAQRRLENHESTRPNAPLRSGRGIKNHEWPPTATELRKACNKLGAELLLETIPLWLEGKIEAREQDHSKATYTEKIKKEDALIDLTGDPYKNFLKIQAYSEWPRAYFMEGKKRVIITAAVYEEGKLILKRVIPEGKKEMAFAEYRRGMIGKLT